MRKTKDQQIATIEKHLRNYNSYRVAIKNLKKQLDYILPNITATYELREGSNGTFHIKSDTEDFAIDRIESKKALIIHEDMERYKMLIETIDNALDDLRGIEREFIQHRYFKRKPFEQIAMELNCSEKYLYSLRNSIMKRLMITLKGLNQFT